MIKKRNRKKTGPKEDLVGKKFGKLTVVSFAGEKIYPSGDRKYLWNCVCDCGNETTPTGNALNRGNTTSCRKCIAADLTGKVFGKLTVMKHVESGIFTDSRGRNVHTWECLCECGNTHFVSSGNLVAGNVKSCGCLFFDVQEKDHSVRKDAFVEKANILHNHKYKYELSNFKNYKSSINIECPIHGVFQQKVRDHLAGSGCQACSIESRKVGLEDFIKRSKESHGDFYDYSLVEYISQSEKVKIICPEHGEFWQIAKSHMDGRRCCQCSNETRHFNYKNFCNLNPDFAKSAGNLYLLKLSNNTETFLKVGVSVIFKNRLSRYRKEGFQIDVLYVKKCSAIESAHMEADILKWIRKKDFKYKPITNFQGKTECAHVKYEEELLEYFRGLDEL